MKKIATTLDKRFCQQFNEKAIGWSRAQLKQGRLNSLKRFILLLVLILCSDVIIALSAPVPKSIRLSNPIDEYLNPRDEQVCVFSASSDVKISGELFVQAPDVIIEFDAQCYEDIKPVTGSINFDDRIIPDRLEKILPVLSHGPPREAAKYVFGPFPTHLENLLSIWYTLSRKRQIDNLFFYQLIKANSGQPEDAKLPVPRGQRGCQRGNNKRTLKFAFVRQDFRVFLFI